MGKRVLLHFFAAIFPIVVASTDPELFTCFVYLTVRGESFHKYFKIIADV